MTTNTTYTSYHNDPQLKSEIVKQMADHVKTDTLIKGDYWDEETQKGCNIGCVLHSDDHSLFPERLGMPVWMAFLHETMHEKLAIDDGREFSKVYSVIPVGISWDQLEIVKYKLLKYILSESKYCSKQYCDERGKKATDAVVALITRAINGDMPTEDEWRAAATAAYAAAAKAAKAAYAAAKAAYDAPYAAFAAAYSAAKAATRYYSAMKDYAGYYMKLLREMRK
jgi:hypothetical protein